MVLLGSIPGNLMECQKKTLKMELNQIATLHQFLLIIMSYQTFVGQTLMDSKKVKTIYIS